MKTLKRIRNRAHRCYELAFKVMLDEPGADKFTLVHGRIPPGIGHAWIETGDGQVYDPVKDTYTPIDAYECRVERRYSRKEMAQIVAKDRTSGPWHNSLEVVAQQCKDDPEFAKAYAKWRGLKPRPVPK